MSALCRVLRRLPPPSNRRVNRPHNLHARRGAGPTLARTDRYGTRNRGAIPLNTQPSNQGTGPTNGVQIGPTAQYPHEATSAKPEEPQARRQHTFTPCNSPERGSTSPPPTRRAHAVVTLRTPLIGTDDKVLARRATDRGVRPLRPRSPTTGRWPAVAFPVSRRQSWLSPGSAAGGLGKSPNWEGQPTWASAGPGGAAWGGVAPLLHAVVLSPQLATGSP